MAEKQKRYYKVKEKVWVKPHKAVGIIEKVDIKNLVVDVHIESLALSTTLKLWEIDKLRGKLETLNKPSKKKDTLLFAKVREGAVVPSKRFEDAGYDFYASIQPTEVDGKEIRELFLPLGQPTLVPTGIASSMSPKYFLNMKHERGSTGKVGMSVLSGVVDSGYRGEIFVNIVPTHKDVLITSEVTETEIGENVILYPYSKAIAQATLEIVPNVEVKEIPYSELEKIPSQRGKTRLGESGK